ncbi:PGF-CTERM sorting domain-containing protein [Halorutilales archaeon Cl-col2-1]
MTLALLIAVVGLVSAPVGAQETGGDSNVTQTVENLQSDLDEALELYRQGDRQRAHNLSHESHHDNWEDPGYEAELSRIDPGLVASLERNIHEKLPSQIENNASVEKVENTTRTVQSQLDEAAVALAQKSESGSDSGSDSSNASTTSSSSEPSGSDSTSNANSLPGFGAVVAVLALVSVAALARLADVK